MNRYEATFKRLKSTGETAFIPFAVAGDPSLKTSEQIFKAYVDAGADILEIGYPFSDPVADGPVNQRGASRAIAAGLDHASFFALIKKLRAYTDIPMGVLMYANSLYHHGIRNFCTDAAHAGIDSILVADLPPEEAAPFLAEAKRAGLATVFIVSELTPIERIAYICKHTTGFVYVVSRLGPTGVQSSVDSGVSATLRRLKSVTKLPLCVGFGLSTPEHIAAVRKAGADGAIVGSALVATVERNLKDHKGLIRKIAVQVGGLKKGTRG